MIREAIEKYNKDKCTGCHACKVSCPVDCIRMEVDAEGFWYPMVSDACIECGKCIKACHLFADNSADNTPTAYACINTDEEVRKRSSSGGVFYELAKQTINNQGVVFGAAFNGSMELEHSYAETLDEITKYQGSKYLQSKIGNSYAEVKSFLKAGRKVLFSGTPCQIGGLKAFLGKDYEKLICVDIICHGVPSPMVWKKYVDYQEEQCNSKIESVAFRDKKFGWKSFNMLLKYRSGENLTPTHREDLFMQAFLKDLCLRPSCYQCDFKTLNRQSDITLADFWGIQRVMPEMDDDKGTSLVLVHSIKGYQLLESLNLALKVKPIDIASAIQYNPSAIKSVAKPVKRERFLVAIKEDVSFENAVIKYTKPSIIIQVKRKGRSVLGKLYRKVFKRK